MECLIVVCLCHLVASQHPNRLLVVSFEGFEADDFNDELTPNIVKLKQSGFFATNVENFFPHHTLPNLLSVATGLSPQNHGILGSTVYDPKSKRILTTSQPEFWDQLKDVSLLWELNEKASVGRYSGVMKWPGVGRGAVPTFRVSYDQLESRRKLIDLEQDFDNVLSWFSDRETPANMVMFYVPFPRTVRFNIIGDGNCLFRALSYGLYHTEERHGEVRQRIVDYVVDHWAELFEVFSNYYISDPETYNLMLKYKLENNNEKKSFISKFVNPAEEHPKAQCSAEEDKCAKDEYCKVNEIEERTGEHQFFGQSEDDEIGVLSVDHREINSGLYKRWMGSEKVWGSMFEIAMFFKAFQHPVSVNMVNPVSGELQHLSTFTFYDEFQPTKPVEGPLVSLLWNGNNQYGHFDILLHPVEGKTSPSPAKTMKELHLAKVDRLLKNLLSELENKELLQDMNMVLLSDHNSRVVYSEDVVYLRDKVPEDKCLLLGASPVMYAIPQPGYSSNSVLMALMQIEGFGDKFKVFMHEQLPEWNLKNSNGNPPLLVVAQTEEKLYAFDDVASQMQLYFLTYQEEKVSAGLGILVDGYAPRNAETPGTIIASGPITRELNHTSTLSSLELFKLFLHVLEIHQD